MEKIKLLWNIGTNYSATTPFWYTLSLNHKFCHTGHRKELHWLDILESQEFWATKVKGRPRYYKYFCNRLRGFVKSPLAYLKTDKPSKLQNARCFTKEEEEYFFSYPTSIEKYIDYRKRHWNHIKHEYHALGDFSNSYCLLSEDFMRSIKDKLLEVFDLKITVCLRDPVRRIWSHNLCKENLIFNKSGGVDRVSDYGKILRSYYNVWGKHNVLPIIMEEFWDPSKHREQTERLSNFLNYPITNIYKNVYWPELGSNSPQYEFLRDQWKDEKDIDSETYKRIYSKLEWIYQDCEEHLGYIPDSWHSL